MTSTIDPHHCSAATFGNDGADDTLDPAHGVPRFRAATRNQIVTIDVPADVMARLSITADTVAESLDLDIEADPTFMAVIGSELLMDHLSDEIVQSLASLGTASATTAVHLTGVAFLEAPHTPTSGVAPDTKMRAHDILLAGAMRIAGTRPVAYKIENGGRIARNVVANPLQAGAASSHGYDVPLFFHQDNCSQPFEDETGVEGDLPAMPYQLGFYAIRNSERVPTRILLVDDVLRGMPEDIIRALSGPDFRIGPPDSVVADGHAAAAISGVPVLRNVGGFLECRYDPFLVTPLTPSAAAANARLILALSEARSRAVDINLSSGDLLIFKNYRLLHMRDKFTPAHAEQSRWLRRFYGAR